MLALNNQIARLEMRCEQLIIHLRTSDRHAADARVRRADLYGMLKELERLKRRRERLETALGLPQAA
jgi:hypothetical protein